MSTATNDGVTLYYETTGSGETVAFVGDAGFGAWQWGWQHGALTGPFETLTFDHRGVGRSDAPAGPCDVETLVGDLHAVLSAHGARRVHLVGAGLGGVVALEYARDHRRVASLVLLGTGGDGSRASVDLLAASPDDPDALRETTERALSDAFVADHADVVEGIVEWRAAEDASLDGWDAHVGALADYRADALYEVTTPALVVHGDADAVWPVDDGEALADDLPRGEFVAYEGAGHLVGVERSRPVDDDVLGFLEDHREDE